MWQVAVAAAVAGSGLLAKHLFAAPQHPAPAPEPLKGNDKESQPHEETLCPSPPSPAKPLTAFDQAGAASDFTGGGRDRRIFRFSSPDSGDPRPAFRIRSKKARVSAKAVRECEARAMGGFSKGNAEQRTKGGGRGGRKRVPCVRRVSLLFKKRKTDENCNGKRDFFCSTDIPSFGWGLGIGIMYMMSTGKEEISKLSDAVDETARVVHELKSELYRRRMGQSLSSSDRGIQTLGQSDNALRRLEAGPTDTKAFNSCSVEDGEGGNSILTEELGTEMDWLEAEFESELRKLPSLVNQASDEPRSTTDFSEIRAFHDPECQSHGVSPAVLSEKLSDVVIKQQENHISELASELKLAHSNLQQKEDELNTLKDCVKRLTEISLSTTSDEETEAWQERYHSVNPSVKDED